MMAQSGNDRSNSPQRQLRKRTTRTGIATAELAVMAIPLMLIVLGLMEVGRMAMAQQYLIEAARAGIRRAMQPDGSDTNGQAAVDSVLANHGFNSSQYTVTWNIVDNSAVVTTAGTTPQAASKNTNLQIVVSMQAQYFSWTSSYFFMGKTETLEARAAMVKQGA